MNASPPNIRFSLRECSPLKRLRTRFAKLSSNGIALQRDFEPQSRRLKNRAVQAFMQTGFHPRYGRRSREPGLPASGGKRTTGHGGGTSGSALWFGATRREEWRTLPSLETSGATFRRQPI